MVKQGLDKGINVKWLKWFFGSIFLIFLLIVGLTVLAPEWLIPEDEDPSPEQMLAFKASVRPGDIVMYSTDWCVFCKQAKKWLTLHQIPFHECDIEASSRCESEYEDHAGSGVPLFVLKAREQTAVVSGFSKWEIVETFVGK